jgi:hypothetical protein
VGRGADLLLYGLTIAFGLYVVSARRELAHVHREILELARAGALQAAGPAAPPTAADGGPHAKPKGPDRA